MYLDVFSVFWTPIWYWFCVLLGFYIDSLPFMDLNRYAVSSHYTYHSMDELNIDSHSRNPKKVKIFIGIPKSRSSHSENKE